MGFCLDWIGDLRELACRFGAVKGADVGDVRALGSFQIKTGFFCGPDERCKSWLQQAISVQ